MKLKIILFTMFVMFCIAQSAQPNPNLTIAVVSNVPEVNQSFSCLFRHKEDLDACTCHLWMGEIKIDSFSRCNMWCILQPFGNYTMRRECDGDPNRGVYNITIGTSNDIIDQYAMRIGFNLVDFALWFVVGLLVLVIFNIFYEKYLA